MAWDEETRKNWNRELDHARRSGNKLIVVKTEAVAAALEELDRLELEIGHLLRPEIDPVRTANDRAAKRIEEHRAESARQLKARQSELQRCRERVKELDARLLDCVQIADDAMEACADTPLPHRVEQLTRIWQNAVRANQGLEAKIDAALALHKPKEYDAGRGLCECGARWSYGECQDPTVKALRGEE